MTTRSQTWQSPPSALLCRTCAEHQNTTDTIRTCVHGLDDDGTTGTRGTCARRQFHRTTGARLRSPSRHIESTAFRCCTGYNIRGTARHNAQRTANVLFATANRDTHDFTSALCSLARSDGDRTEVEGEVVPLKRGEEKGVAG